jgi:CW-type Zinc Finger.
METIIPEWVQCDRCAKWRKCDPKVIEPFKNKKWTSDLTPDLRNLVGCEHAEEPWDEAWEEDENGEWQLKEPPITRKEIFAMKDCGCCAVCRKKKRRPPKGISKTSKAHEICVSKRELLSTASKDDKTESSPAQPVQDASVTSTTTVTVATLATLFSAHDEVDERGDESGESAVPKLETTAEVIDVDADSSVSTNMPFRVPWKRLEDLEICKKRGLLTDAEYADKRRRIINDM